MLCSQAGVDQHPAAHAAGQRDTHRVATLCPAASTCHRLSGSGVIIRALRSRQQRVNRCAMRWPPVILFGEASVCGILFGAGMSSLRRPLPRPSSGHIPTWPSARLHGRRQRVPCWQRVGRATNAYKRWSAGNDLAVADKRPTFLFLPLTYARLAGFCGRGYVPPVSQCHSTVPGP